MPCGRCVRRETAHQCSYEPDATQTPRRRKPRAAILQADKHVHASTSRLRGDESLQTAQPRRLSETVIYSDSVRTGQLGSFATSPLLGISAQSNQVGFMGSSSYLAVFDQTNGTLDPLETGNSLDPAISPAPVAEDLVRKGANVLFHLRDLKLLDSLLQRWLSLGDGYVVFGPIYRTWIREIKEYLGPVLGQVTSPDELLDVSLVVWQNTRMPIKINGATTAHDWARRTAGQYLRWEVVGLLFSAIGIVSGSLSNRDTIFSSHQDSVRDRPSLVRVMLDLVNHCIDFSKVCTSHNDLHACLLVS